MCGPQLCGKHPIAGKLRAGHARPLQRSGFFVFNYTTNRAYNTTPSLKIEISRKPFFSAQVCLPEATSSTSRYRSAPASSSVRSPSATTPALKSIQVFFLAASGCWWQFSASARGRPNGVPRPVLNSTMCAPRSQCRGGDQVVAGAVQHVQALGGDGLAVVDDIHDRRGATLLHAAAGLVLQRRDAALLVARARLS